MPDLIGPRLADFTCKDCGFTTTEDVRDPDAGARCLMCDSPNVERAD